MNLDIHIWVRDEDEFTSALCTISTKKGQPICYGLPLDGAMDCLREHIERQLEGGAK